MDTLRREPICRGRLFETNEKSLLVGDDHFVPEEKDAFVGDDYLTAFFFGLTIMATTQIHLVHTLAALGRPFGSPVWKSA